MLSTWDVIVAGVLSGELSLETVPGVPRWPRKGGSAGSFAVLMHPSAPGAVGLLGNVRGSPAMAVSVSDRLRDFCVKHRTEYFDSERARTLLEAEIVLTQAMWSQIDGSEDRLLLVCGIDAAELLRELERVRREGLH